MSISPDFHREMLEAGAKAPSGDNLQPWSAKWHGDALALAIDPARDRSLYNFRHHASLIALGAMIENITIAATRHGIDARTSVKPDGNDLLFATMTFEHTGRAVDPLAAFIAARVTNRKPYKRTPLAPGAADALARAIPHDGRANLLMIENAGQMRVLSRAASTNDRLLFEIKALHERFFESLRWTTDDAEQTRDGLFVKTLELGPMAAGFKAMRSWSLVALTNLIGGSVFAPSHSFRTFVRSSAFGFLQMTDDSRESFVEGGRAIERLWLTAASLGLSFQPMAGMLYLLNYASGDDSSPVGRRQRELIVSTGQMFKQVLPLDGRKAPIMLFRLGYGAPPSATSLRRAL